MTLRRRLARLLDPGQEKLGTFLGVFTPSILTILGVILYLRLGWVVGSVGLLPALAIVVVAHLITVATALSVAAVATNMHVGAGGAYYIISRSLGLEIGGAIGIPLFLAQTFSVTLYSFGLAESLQLVWPEVPVQPAAAIIVLAVSILSGKSAGLALRLQVPIMAAIALSLVSFFAGVGDHARGTVPLWAGAVGAPPFWAVFAVFFPAVTGLMAGVSLSGDLADPKRAIPRGTLAAVGVGFVVYFVVPFALAVSGEPNVLMGDTLFWFRVATVPVLIFPGLWGAIFSSAVGSMLGAPRTLEALVDDRVVPRGLAGKGLRGRGPGMAHVLSTAVALGAVALGTLNAVAPVLTMFFLTTYGMVNLVAGLEELSGAPSYRPTIRVPWAVSLGGAVGCFWVMFLINPWACLIAVVVEVGIYLALRRRALRAAWGDLRYGALMSLGRVTLLKLRRLPVAPRNWRPHILLFAGDPEKRRDLVRFAAWLNQDRGILTVCHLVVGSLEEWAPKAAGRADEMNRVLEQEGLTAFAEVDVVSDFRTGVVAVAQANGIAGISSNTVMFGWTDKPDRLANILRVMRQTSLLGKSTVICRVAQRRWGDARRRIDVWWGGLQNNGDLLLLFAHLLAANPAWRGSKVRVKSVASNEMMAVQTEKSLRSMIEGSRIAAEIEILQKPAGTNLVDLIHEQSRDADIVFLGLREPEEGKEEEYAGRLLELVGELPTVILVRGAGPFAGQLL